MSNLGAHASFLAPNFSAAFACTLCSQYVLQSATTEGAASPHRVKTRILTQPTARGKSMRGAARAFSGRGAAMDKGLVYASTQRQQRKKPRRSDGLRRGVRVVRDRLARSPIRADQASVGASSLGLASCLGPSFYGFFAPSGLRGPRPLELPWACIRSRIARPAASRSSPSKRPSPFLSNFLTNSCIPARIASGLRPA